MHASRLRKFIRWLYRNRSISLTSEGTRFVVLAFAIGLAAMNTGNNLLYLLLAMMLSLIVLSGILSERCLKHLVVQRRLPEHLFAGRPATAYFSITNRKTHSPSFSMKVQDVIDDRPVDRGVYVLQLGPGASTLKPYPLLMAHRGLYRIDGVKILTSFPFSLFIKGLTIPLESEAVVYPEVTTLPHVVHAGLQTLGYNHPVPRRGQGEDLYNLRLYQPGDDSRSIHWRTTARTSTLVVRETEAEDHRRVTLILPTVLPPAYATHAEDSSDAASAFEKAVVLTASLAAHFHEQGYAVGAVVGDQIIPTETGPTHLHRIFRALALCMPAAHPQTVAASHRSGYFGGHQRDVDFRVLVLPWKHDPLEHSQAGVNTIFRVWELGDAAHDA